MSNEKCNELKVDNYIIASEQWVKNSIRKGLSKKFRDFYVVNSVNRLNNGEYYIKLIKGVKI